jgi:ferrous iron transport protein A
MIPLSMARPGEKARVVRILGGRGFVRRVTEMGFYLGAEIEIISNAQAGPLLIRLGGSRFGIGFGIAQRIFVTSAD